MYRMVKQTKEERHILQPMANSPVYGRLATLLEGAGCVFKILSGKNLKILFSGGNIV